MSGLRMTLDVLGTHQSQLLTKSQVVREFTSSSGMILVANVLFFMPQDQEIVPYLTYIYIYPVAYIKVFLFLPMFGAGPLGLHVFSKNSN